MTSLHGTVIMLKANYYLMNFLLQVQHRVKSVYINLSGFVDEAILSIDANQ